MCTSGTIETGQCKFNIRENNRIVIKLLPITQRSRRYRTTIQAGYPNRQEMSDQFNFSYLKNIRLGLLGKGKNIEYNWTDCAFVCFHGVLKAHWEKLVRSPCPTTVFCRKLLIGKWNKFGKYCQTGYFTAELLRYF